jgi:hypothetical protein
VAALISATSDLVAIVNDRFLAFQRTLQKGRKSVRSSGLYSSLLFCGEPGSSKKHASHCRALMPVLVWKAQARRSSSIPVRSQKASDD